MMNLHAPDRNEFMHHAYNALYTGNIHSLPDPLVAVMVDRVMEDVCTVVRSMPVWMRDEFLEKVTRRVRTS